MEELSFLNFGARTLYLRDDAAREGLEELADRLVNGSIVTAHDVQTASFYDTEGGIPLAALVLNIKGSQGGSGTPSPTNPRPFSGFTACRIMHSGADISQPDTVTISLPGAAGAVYGGTLDVLSGKLRVTHAAKTISGDSDIADMNTSRKFAIVSLPGIAAAGVNTAAELETLKCDRFCTLGTDQTWNNFDLYISKYSGNTNAVIKYADVFTSRASAAAWFAENPTTIVYALSEPVEYTLEGQTVASLKGANSLWADSGSIETVSYRLPASSGGSASGGGSRPFLRVLAFGNSFTYSTLEYLPHLLEELLPETEIVMGICYDSGCTLARHAAKFRGGDSSIPAAYERYSEYQRTAQEWVNVSDVYTAQRALDKFAWDVIIFQQSVENLQYFDDLSDFAGLVAGYLTYPALLVYNMAQARHPNDSSWLPSHMSGDTGTERSDNHLLAIADFARRALATPYISGVLPGGTAVQNLRSCAFAAGTGESGYFSKDSGGHLQEGIGPLCASYAAAYRLMELIGETPKLFGLPLTPTDGWMQEKNLPFRTATGPCMGVSAETIAAAQKCAMMACKKPFEITDCSAL